MGKIIEIDLGTKNSPVAVMEGNKPVIIPNRFGTQLLSSVETIKENEGFVVGNPLFDPANIIIRTKRLMGRKFNEVFDSKRVSMLNASEEVYFIVTCLLSGKTEPCSAGEQHAKDSLIDRNKYCGWQLSAFLPLP